MTGTGRLEIVERLTNECIDLCRTVLRSRKYLDPLLEPAFREARVKRAVDEQKTAIAEMESAVSRILTAAEDIAELDLAAADAAERIAASYDKIVEACCFQDITGQRLSGVVETLGRVGEALDSVAEGRPLAEIAEEKESLLNGPALPGRGLEQDLVDRLLADGNG
ncbi:hypothetical protein [Parvibaculum sp.]|jgi:chemotaxis protein CheZ|uniref:hypothetical protein n=1 Tax=Parvibaculum sp. TaxID=2024848 RepID=UPI001B219699|nr:hypothetical protein [Parvibaculum sp.]MBO6678265.1 hypothetical protein [Parvibaculum sp.]MBO6684519.1 hypothetical protein [Parvibaculum sp.]MBO6903856.1 hypothetical protein [Parvibaculum sp.]